eukprot:Rmarinus@m.4212
MSDDNFDDFSDDAGGADDFGDSNGSAQDHDSDFNYGDDNDSGVYDGKNREPLSLSSKDELKGGSTTTLIKNDHVDEAVELSDDNSNASDSMDADGEGAANTTIIKNDHVDEAVELDDDGEDMPSPTSSEKQASAMAGSASASQSQGSKFQASSSHGAHPAHAGTGLSDDDELSDKPSDDEDDSSSEEDGGSAKFVQGGYNPTEFSNLQVSKEVHELFHYIVAFKPHELELPTMVRPFIPDYIPAVGDTDAFIKIPRPDNPSRVLGLTELDEPGEQSDPSVVEAKLLQFYKGKKTTTGPTVRSIESAQKQPNEIQKWVDAVEELHQGKPAPTVNYSKNMPEIESLMQIWPQEIESTVAEIGDVARGDICMSTSEFSKLACAVLDIPVHANVIESLHVMFTLYSEFKQSEHFAAGDDGDEPNMMVTGVSPPTTATAQVPEADEVFMKDGPDINSLSIGPEPR